MEKALRIESPQHFGIRITLWIRSGHKTQQVEIPSPKTEERRLTEAQGAYIYRLLQMPK